MTKLTLIIIISVITGAEGFLTNLCRSGWEEEQNSCYLFVKTNENWSEAQEHCEIFHANLAEVENATGNHFLQQAIRNRNMAGTMFWIGASDIEVKGHWKWISSDKNVTFFDWGPGEPNNLGKDEGCIEMNEDHWNDKSCQTTHGFICEYQLDMPTSYIIG